MAATPQSKQGKNWYAPEKVAVVSPSVFAQPHGENPIMTIVYAGEPLVGGYRDVLKILKEREREYAARPEVKKQRKAERAAFRERLAAQGERIPPIIVETYRVDPIPTYGRDIDFDQRDLTGQEEAIIRVASVLMRDEYVNPRTKIDAKRRSQRQKQYAQDIAQLSEEQIERIRDEFAMMMADAGPAGNVEWAKGTFERYVDGPEAVAAYMAQREAERQAEHAARESRALVENAVFREAVQAGFDENTARTLPLELRVYANYSDERLRDELVRLETSLDSGEPQPNRRYRWDDRPGKIEGMRNVLRWRGSDPNWTRQPTSSLSAERASLESMDISPRVASFEMCDVIDGMPVDKWVRLHQTHGDRLNWDTPTALFDIRNDELRAAIAYPETDHGFRELLQAYLDDRMAGRKVREEGGALAAQQERAMAKLHQRRMESKQIISEHASFQPSDTIDGAQEGFAAAVIMAFTGETEATNDKRPPRPKRAPASPMIASGMYDDPLLTPEERVMLRSSPPARRRAPHVRGPRARV